METLDIRKMSVSQRLKVIDEIWKSIVEEESDVESPDWHYNVLDERRKRMDSGEDKFINVERLINRTGAK